MDILCYRPKEDVDLSVILLHHGENISPSVARKLYNLHAVEKQALGKKPLDYHPNLIYQFRNGLAFRLFDDGLEGGKPTLEFAVPPFPGRDKQDTLAALPEMLKSVGISDAEVLEKLAVFIEGLARPRAVRQH